MYQLQVEGMSCNHCVGAVNKSIREVDASARVEVDLSTQQIRVDTKASLEELSAALEDAGYPVLHHTSI